MARVEAEGAREVRGGDGREEAKQIDECEGEEEEAGDEWREDGDACEGRRMRWWWRVAVCGGVWWYVVAFGGVWWCVVAFGGVWAVRRW